MEPELRTRNSDSRGALSSILLSNGTDGYLWISGKIFPRKWFHDISITINHQLPRNSEDGNVITSTCPLPTTEALLSVSMGYAYTHTCSLTNPFRFLPPLPLGYLSVDVLLTSHRDSLNYMMSKFPSSSSSLRNLSLKVISQPDILCNYHNGWVCLYIINGIFCAQWQSKRRYG